MNNIHPVRRIIIVIVSLGLMLVYYFSFFVPISKEHQQLFIAMAQQQEEVDKIDLSSKKVVDLQVKKKRQHQRLSNLQLKLKDPPKAEQALEIIVTDLKRLGIELSAYHPLTLQKNKEAGKKRGKIQRNHSQINFKATFHQFLELLSKWRKLPFVVHFDLLRLVPVRNSKSTMLSVTLNYSIISSSSFGEGIIE